MMYPPPSGAELSAAQAQELDDTFFSSDPYSQSCARIAMMVDWADQERKDEGPPSFGEMSRTLQEYTRKLGFIPEPQWTPSSSAIETHIAQDAFSLRHHLAEATMRLAWAALTIEDGDNACLWARLSDSPNSLPDVIQGVRERISMLTLTDFAGLVLDPGDIAGTSDGNGADKAAATYATWLEYAGLLLHRTDIWLNGANNKIKHGLAIRSRNDVRIDLHVGPIDPRGLTVSQANAPAVKIFDRPVLEALHHAPTPPRASAPLEVSLLRVDTPTVLAESQMFAMLHGSMFHVLAAKHFHARRGLPDQMHAPRHPGLPVDGPLPQAGPPSVVGMRLPLTTRQEGGEVERKAGIVLSNSFVGLNFEGEVHESTVIADDSTSIKQGE